MASTVAVSISSITSAALCWAGQACDRRRTSPAASSSLSSPCRRRPLQMPSTTRCKPERVRSSGSAQASVKPGPEVGHSKPRSVERVREAGAVLLGPNCLGLLDVAAELYLTSNHLPSGPIGLISQSGNLALELGEKAAQALLGFSRFASTGNQADVDVAELIVSFAASDSVEAVAVYCEDFRDGRRFLEAASACAAAGKPVVLLAVGTSQAAARAARSHTGAIVSGTRSIDAACNAAGVERVLDAPADDRRHRRSLARLGPDRTQSRRSR